MTVDELIKIADKIADTLQSPLHKATLRDNPPARIAVSLCLTIIEIYGAVSLILKSKSQTHSALLIRGMQECLANLTCIYNDPEYVNQIYLDDANQNLKTIRGFINDGDLELSNEERYFWESRMVEESRIIKTHTDRNRTPQKFIDKFKSAGMLKDYQSTYAVLSGMSHNNLTTLLSRHGAKGDLLFSEPLPLETARSFIKMSLGLYAMAIEKLPKFTDIDETELKQLIESTDEEFKLLG